MPNNVYNPTSIAVIAVSLDKTVTQVNENELLKSMDCVSHTGQKLKIDPGLRDFNNNLFKN